MFNDLKLIKADPLLCPFCHITNYCDAKNRTCWCFDIVVPQELILMLPTPLAAKACICSKCVQLFNRNPSKFKRKYVIE